ncbi:MAG: Imm42 family immunity protein [Deltaproteobacteria bacterium]|nr:Imm42 family immunity protein [Deltaproteobacteria bacterium]
MIAGNRERFAIEAEIEECIDGFTLGHLRFWICGRAVGDWEDSVDLLGCLRWLKDFRDHPRKRFEPGLWHLPAGEVFRRVYDPVMAGAKSASESCVPDAYARFHISHLGMSSFNRFDLLLLEDEHGAERCLWREAATEDLHECYLKSFEMESVAGEFCEQLEQIISVSR